MYTKAVGQFGKGLEAGTRHFTDSRCDRVTMTSWRGSVWQKLCDTGITKQRWEVMGVYKLSGAGVQVWLCDTGITKYRAGKGWHQNRARTRFRQGKSLGRGKSTIQTAKGAETVLENVKLGAKMDSVRG